MPKFKKQLGGKTHLNLYENEYAFVLHRLLRKPEIKFKRFLWTKFSYITLKIINNNPHFQVCIDGKLHEWLPSTEDLCANDWIEVKEL
jgi:hypothetical protein